MARTALFMAISSMATRGELQALENFQDVVVSMLVRQGFDKHASHAVFDELVAKYRDGDWPFRRKPHLLYPDGADQEG
ncbi:hypothetical protein J2Y48_003449 [Mycoplana sp. BE70]|uniref:hypothetical protein n=1 Tax=Mycoplana sp. BE70 TaxID=2817775 RepID=UPI0028553CC5|nr:hypothetical protein [Mycoplana sp. BE70]MDR6758151.1 hypothetical protein [Mycoplana sp. BE70]